MRCISAKTLAVMLDVSDRTIRYWAARGMIPGTIRVGRQFRFRLTEVEAWLNTMDVSQQQGKVQWPTSTSVKDQPSIRPASGSPEALLENQLLATAQRLLSKRQTASNEN
ncbi:MAG: helix-turn-helix domain-containing protein [Mesorhizobium sp.]|nr:MAG: helix-turn-helix domain-containing protein [Mesorhizobium sp.]